MEPTSKETPAKTWDIVLDTNIVVAGLRSKRGSAFRLLEFVGSDRFSVHLSVPLILEYEDVLTRQLPDLGISKDVVSEFLDYHCAVARWHPIFFLWRPLPDPKDEMVLELAVKAKCDFIITYNQRDFKNASSFGVEVLNPGEFLKLIGEL